MTEHVLERRQLLRATRREVFAFFEDPKNLESITPGWLRFHVRASTHPRVQRDTEIEYRLRWWIFPLRWRSRISEYEHGSLFADEMLVGPYRKWYHTHTFNEVDGGVEMVDRVEYGLPLGWLGRLVHRLVVRRQLEAIFDYRSRAIARVFVTEA